MITYIIYSHSEYSDVLSIATDHLRSMDKILFFDKPYSNDDKFSHIMKQYKRIIQYNDFTPYGSRLFTCLNYIRNEYIVFLHDIDIVLYQNSDLIVKLIDIMKCNNIDRIDLQNSNDELYFNNNIIQVSESLFLDKQDRRNQYIYNVNPSIWKTSSFYKLLSNLLDKNYRNIEHGISQEYCYSNFNMYKVYSRPAINAGYFSCIPEFQFLHITHDGKFLPFQFENAFCDEQIFNKWIDIVNKYDLKNGMRKFHNTRYD